MFESMVLTERRGIMEGKILFGQCTHSTPFPVKNHALTRLENPHALAVNFYAKQTEPGAEAPVFRLIPVLPHRDL